MTRSAAARQHTMATVPASALEAWRGAQLAALQARLAGEAPRIEDEQRSALISRKSLAERTRGLCLLTGI